MTVFFFGLGIIRGQPFEETSIAFRRPCAGGTTIAGYSNRHAAPPLSARFIRAEAAIRAGYMGTRLSRWFRLDKPGGDRLKKSSIRW